jgi:hypothetical protein
MKPAIKSFVLMVLLFLSIFSSAFLTFVLAQSGTNLSGVIDSDSTWTRSGSPYSLTGPVAIVQGITLTIEQGTTVNLNSYYMQINGTLHAIGIESEKVTFNGGQIIFTLTSNGWAEQAKSGCIIENALINQTLISSNNPIKIDKCIINSQISVTSSIISNNVVTGEIRSSSPIGSGAVDSSIISNNNVKGKIVLGSVSLGAISAPSESSTVSNNIVEGSIISGSPQGIPQIFNNIVTEGGIGCDGYANIFNNYVYGCQNGISLYTMRVFGGNLPCYATVQNNKVTENSVGISISLSSVNGGATQTPTILNNTISSNKFGISLSGFGYDKTPTIQYNNLQDNSDYNFYLQESNNADVSYNWWGTTDESIISKSIYDYKNDFNLGKVTFTPILNSPNTQTSNVTFPNQTALPNPNPTITTSSNSTITSATNPPVSTNTSMPSQPETNPNSITLPLNLFILIIATLGLALVILSVLVFRPHKRTQSNQT